MKKLLADFAVFGVLCWTLLGTLSMFVGFGMMSSEESMIEDSQETLRAAGVSEENVERFVQAVEEATEQGAKWIGVAVALAFVNLGILVASLGWFLRREWAPKLLVALLAVAFVLTAASSFASVRLQLRMHPVMADAILQAKSAEIPASSAETFITIQRWFLLAMTGTLLILRLGLSAFASFLVLTVPAPSEPRPTEPAR